ncbi:tripartite motif containing 101 isoform X1 [Micropterus salmoides]|uniref:tripartite motif containing 101 isoform X1 n=1 Tax=Micropterus salmoides TaxID=27706 RepID=UPI0018EAEC0F|nr:tripartite motif containing 101 isoform X1 [Micropterus salmoides]
MERKEEVKIGGAAMSLPADLSCLQAGGGAEGEAALANLEKQLICPICLELFNKPVVILPCQHNLCRKCANELYQPSLFQARTTMMVNSGRFRCPSCRHEVVLDRHGVYGLPRNLLVENIIDVYKQEVSNNNNATSPAPPPGPPPAQVTCSDHEGEKVNIYCVTCQVPTCSLCKVFGAHQSCQVAPLTDIYQQQKDELNEGVSSLVAFNDKVQALINGLEEACKNIEENSKTQKQSVCEKFNRVFSILEDRRKAMTQRISSEQEEKTGHAEALVRCYGDSVEANRKLVESSLSSMEEPDMAAFVQNSRELITKLVAATSSCPAETLKPGYETMSHYKYNFSRQERALKSIDFLKVVEDVPEEPEVEPEPEEPEEPSVQNTEPEHNQETSFQNLESVSDPVEEPIPGLIFPPVEPVQTAAPTSAPVSPVPDLVRDSVEPAGAVLQPETDELDLNDEGPGLMKNNKEEEIEEAEGVAAPDPVSEGNVCEHVEGMSTQQSEEGEAESDAADRTEKHDPQGEEEEIQVKEEVDSAFSPSWRRLSPEEILPKVHETEQKMCPLQPAGDSLSEARTEVALVSEPEIQPQSQRSLDSQSSSHPPPGAALFHPHQLPLSTELHAQPYLPLPRLPQQLEKHPQPHESRPQPQKAPAVWGSAFVEASITEDENEEEEEDMQGWVCLPGAVDKGFKLVEGSFDLGEVSLDSFSDNNDSPSSIPPEETRSGPERGSSEMDKDNSELSDGRVEEEEHLASELKESGLGEGEYEAEAMNERPEKGSVWSDERSEEQGNNLSALERDAVSTREDSSEVKNYSLDVGDRGVERTDSVISGDGSSGFAEKKEEDGENSEQPEDLNAKLETSAAETEEKITSSVSLQAVILLFYLLAFLVILQRVWAYIGCFICT